MRSILSWGSLAVMMASSAAQSDDVNDDEDNGLGPTDTFLVILSSFLTLCLLCGAIYFVKFVLLAKGNKVEPRKDESSGVNDQDTSEISGTVSTTSLPEGYAAVKTEDKTEDEEDKKEDTRNKQSKKEDVADKNQEEMVKNEEMNPESSKATTETETTMDVKWRQRRKQDEDTIQPVSPTMTAPLADEYIEVIPESKMMSLKISGVTCKNLLKGDETTQSDTYLRFSAAGISEDSTVVWNAPEAGFTSSTLPTIDLPTGTQLPLTVSCVVMDKDLKSADDRLGKMSFEISKTGPGAERDLPLDTQGSVSLRWYLMVS